MSSSVQPGDRMLIPCVGGRWISRLVTFPPPVEVETDRGMYVLVDDGPPETWIYEFAPSD